MQKILHGIYCNIPFKFSSFGISSIFTYAAWEPSPLSVLKIQMHVCGEERDKLLLMCRYTVIVRQSRAVYNFQAIAIAKDPSPHKT